MTKATVAMKKYIFWLAPLLILTGLFFWQVVLTYFPKEVCEYHNEHERVCGLVNASPFVDAGYILIGILMFVSTVYSIYLCLFKKARWLDVLGTVLSVLVSAFFIFGVVYAFGNQGP